MTFREKVYNLTKSIPKGKVATYKQIAKLAGNYRAVRAVGYFMKTNQNAPLIPCHRVVGWDGSLVGYSGKGGKQRKKEMLISEGVNFKGSKVDFITSLWTKTA